MTLHPWAICTDKLSFVEQFTSKKVSCLQNNVGQYTYIKATGQHCYIVDDLSI